MMAPTLGNLELERGTGRCVKTKITECNYTAYDIKESMKGKEGSFFLCFPVILKKQTAVFRGLVPDAACGE